MKMNNCYIYINRNWGDGYGDAAPFCSRMKGWMHSKSKRAADGEFECFQQRLRAGAGVTSYYNGGFLSDVVRPLFLEWCFLKWYLNCYVAKFVAPDKECPDPLARGRDPRITVYLIFEGCPQILPVARFDFFVKKCLDVALAIKSPGKKKELKVPIPNGFFSEED